MALDTCKICFAFLGSSKRIKVMEIVDLLEILLVQLNCKLLEESLICDSCLMNVQSACNFKISYLENSQKLYIKQEDVENETVCEICKGSVSLNDSIPMLYSVTDIDKLNLYKFLSSELQLKSQDSHQICELCHKSILNFSRVIKSFSIFAQDKISNEAITVSDLNLKKLNSERDVIMNSVDCKMDIKKEYVEIKEEQKPITTYEDFLCKNEELVLKTEEEQISCQLCQEVGMTECVSYNSPTNKKSHQIELFKCHNCSYQTKYKDYFKKHTIVHKKPDEVEMFKCDICDYQTKYKNSLKIHIMVHKKPDEVEMFKCDMCNLQTKYKTYYKNHLQLCDDRTKYISSRKRHTTVNNNSNEAEIFKCQLCDYQTIYKHHFKKHISVHKNSVMLKSQICDFQTTIKNNFKKLLH